MTVAPADVIQIVEALDARGVQAWLDGGWGVDALLGEQTREHADLDLIVKIEDMPQVREVLGRDGFDVVKDVPDSNIVFRDPSDREIEVHPVRLADDGAAVYRMESGGDWRFAPGSFEGLGIVAGREVRCLTADAQILCHAQGYPASETDLQDMRLLHERVGTQLLPPYAQR